VSGGCYSACTLIFIGGKERAFATGHRPLVTALGVHGAHDPETKLVNPAVMPQMYALYKMQIGEKFDSTLMNQALYSIEDAGGMLRMREVQRNRPAEQAPWFCAKARTPLAQCQRYVGKDAFSLGLVTQAETVEIELPPAFRPVLAFYGQPLSEPSAEAVRSKIASRMASACERMGCKVPADEQADGWMQKGSYRAVAFASNQPGFGTSWGLGSPPAALARALYACNHLGRGHKLCQLGAIDDHDLEPIYAHITAQGLALRSQLPVPSSDALDAERSEPGMSTAKAFRLAEHDQLTPGAVAGVRRIDTAELVSLMKAPNPPVLIDVAPGVPAMLPGALHFMSAGLAFADAAQEAAYDRRFRDMLDAAVPDKTSPVVIYCASSSSWHSVNASLRAAQAGYTQVLWYRAGLRGWQSAELPTVGKLPVAALQ
jgi:rhodanese-related sulfurtransferase